MGIIINRLSNPDNGENRANSRDSYISLPTDSTGTPIDFNSPLPYIEWIRYQDSIDPNNQYALYIQYIINWYNSGIENGITSDVLYTSYLSVLESLSLVFRDEIQDDWVRDLNFNSDLDVQDGIEYYSRKLKEIAIYYINKRESAKNTKLKYNLVGSTRGIEELFEDYILKAFTQRDYVLNLPSDDIYRKLPQLSSIADDAHIIIDTYYDTGNYFDKSPNVPVSSYFIADNNAALLSSLNITISGDDLYSMGILDSVTTSQLTNQPPTSLSAISDPINQESFETVMRDITQRFTSAIKHRLQIYQTLDNVLTSEYALETGNNWFYWPSGEYVFEQEDLDVISINLNNTTLIDDGATGGSTYAESDKIFVTNTSDNSVQAAWLKFTENATSTKTMSAEIDPNTDLLFKFPYPGYGDAADTLAWTGPSLTNINALYRYADADTQRVIEKAYFNDTTQLSGQSIDPININNTKLIESGANSALTYAAADKISRRITDNDDNIHDLTPNSVFTGDFNHSWLYNFTRTNLSLPPGQTKIIWPYKTYADTPSLTFSPSGDVCNTIALSTINVVRSLHGATAGQGLYDSDIIYKINNVDGDATECAFLSGAQLSAVMPGTPFTAGIKGVLQPGLNLKCEPGIPTTFLWCGADSTTLESVNVRYHPPADDSEFLSIKHNSIYESRNQSLQEIEAASVIDASTSYEDFGKGPGVGDWKTEQYRTPLFSPIGHIGGTYDEYDGMADIIFLDWQYPSPFSINDWRDNDGNDYTTSPDFAWFKLSANPTHSDVGFGPGEWVNYSGNSGTFTLKEGYQYKYIRANLNRSQEELESSSVPYLIVKHDYTNHENSFDWIATTVQSDGTWAVSGNNLSDITLSPGDRILYDHADSTTYCLSTLDTRGFSNTRSVSAFTPAFSSFQYWTAYSAAPTGTTISVLWPDTVFDTTIANFERRSDITDIDWRIESPGQGEHPHYVITNADPDSIITFVLSTVGVYSLSGTTDSGYSSPVIQISASEEVLFQVASGSLQFETVNYPNIALDMCIQLSGWNPTTYAYDGSTSEFAKPFWAKAYDDDSSNTKNKGTSIYGTNLGFFNEYNVRTQPEIDSWDLSIGDAIKYEHKGDNRVVWIEDIEFQDLSETYEWKRLDINEASHPLQTFACLTANQLVVSGTDVKSDIELSPYTSTCRGNILINYYAQSPFTWTQPISTEFTNTITIVTSSVDSTPSHPWAYLTNRHYPTMAMVPDVTNLVPSRDLGIFKPSNLGFNEFYTRSHTQTLTTTFGAFGTYQDIDVYETDYGFTKETNESVVDFLEYDAQWMKYDVTAIDRSGEIKNPGAYQKFIPYSSASEHKPVNNSTIDNFTDPWTGPRDETWRDTEGYPLDFRGQEKIQTWYNENITPNNIIYQYADDVYGNRYYLFKNVDNVNLYDQRTVNGQLWVKTGDNLFGPATNLLTEVFDNYKGRSYYSKLINGEIRNIYCFADILIFILDDVVLFERIQYNYNTATIFSIVDDSQTIDISNKLFGDVQADLDNKQIFTTITDPGIGFAVYRYDIDDRQLIQMFPNELSTNTILMTGVTAIENSTYDIPLLAFNEYTNNYNVSFYTNVTSDTITNITDQYLVSINLNETSNYFNIKSVDIILPTT